MNLLFLLTSIPIPFHAPHNHLLLAYSSLRNYERAERDIAPLHAAQIALHLLSPSILSSSSRTDPYFTDSIRTLIPRSILRWKHHPETKTRSILLTQWKTIASLTLHKAWSDPSFNSPSTSPLLPWLYPTLFSELHRPLSPKIALQDLIIAEEPLNLPAQQDLTMTFPRVHLKSKASMDTRMSWSTLETLSLATLLHQQSEDKVPLVSDPSTSSEKSTTSLDASAQGEGSSPKVPPVLQAIHQEMSKYRSIHQHLLLLLLQWTVIHCQFPKDQEKEFHVPQRPRGNEDHSTGMDLWSQPSNLTQVSSQSHTPEGSSPRTPLISKVKGDREDLTYLPHLYHAIQHRLYGQGMTTVTWSLLALAMLLRRAAQDGLAFPGWDAPRDMALQMTRYPSTLPASLSLLGAMYAYEVVHRERGCVEDVFWAREVIPFGPKVPKALLHPLGLSLMGKRWKYGGLSLRAMRMEMEGLMGGLIEGLSIEERPLFPILWMLWHGSALLVTPDPKEEAEEDPSVQDLVPLLRLVQNIQGSGLPNGLEKSYVLPPPSKYDLARCQNLIMALIEAEERLINASSQDMDIPMSFALPEHFDEGDKENERMSDPEDSPSSGQDEKKKDALTPFLLLLLTLPQSSFTPDMKDRVRDLVKRSHLHIQDSDHISHGIQCVFGEGCGWAQALIPDVEQEMDRDLRVWLLSHFDEHVEQATQNMQDQHGERKCVLDIKSRPVGDVMFDTQEEDALVRMNDHFHETHPGKRREKPLKKENPFSLEEFYGKMAQRGLVSPSVLVRHLLLLEEVGEDRRFYHLLSHLDLSSSECPMDLQDLLLILSRLRPIDYRTELAPHRLDSLFLLLLHLVKKAWGAKKPLDGIKTSIEPYLVWLVEMRPFLHTKSHLVQFGSLMAICSMAWPEEWGSVGEDEVSALIWGEEEVNQEASPSSSSSPNRIRQGPSIHVRLALGVVMPQCIQGLGRICATHIPQAIMEGQEETGMDPVISILILIQSLRDPGEHIPTVQSIVRMAGWLRTRGIEASIPATKLQNLEWRMAQWIGKVCFPEKAQKVSSSIMAGIGFMQDASLTGYVEELRKVPSWSVPFGLFGLAPDDWKTSPCRPDLWVPVDTMIEGLWRRLDFRGQTRDQPFKDGRLAMNVDDSASLSNGEVLFIQDIEVLLGPKSLVDCHTYLWVGAQPLVEKKRVKYPWTIHFERMIDTLPENLPRDGRLDIYACGFLACLVASMMTNQHMGTLPVEGSEFYLMRRLLMTLLGLHEIYDRVILYGFIKGFLNSYSSRLGPGKEDFILHHVLPGLLATLDPMKTTCEEALFPWIQPFLPSGYDLLLQPILGWKCKETEGVQDSKALEKGLKILLQDARYEEEWLVRLLEYWTPRLWDCESSGKGEVSGVVSLIEKRWTGIQDVRIDRILGFLHLRIPRGKEDLWRMKEEESSVSENLMLGLMQAILEECLKLVYAVRQPGISGRERWIKGTRVASGGVLTVLWVLSDIGKDSIPAYLVPFMEAFKQVPMNTRSSLIREDQDDHPVERTSTHLLAHFFLDALKGNPILDRTIGLLRQLIDLHVDIATSLLPHLLSLLLSPSSLGSDPSMILGSHVLEKDRVLSGVKQCFEGILAIRDPSEREVIQQVLNLLRCIRPHYTQVNPGKWCTCSESS